jgi:hypothetical protein
MCLNETCSKVRISKNLSDVFPIQNGPEKGHVFSLFLFKFALEYLTTKVEDNQDDLELNATRQLLLYDDNVNMLDENIIT